MICETVTKPGSLRFHFRTKYGSSMRDLRYVHAVAACTKRLPKETLKRDRVFLEREIGKRMLEATFYHSL